MEMKMSSLKKRAGGTDENMGRRDEGQSMSE